jgi:hypothetical protein
MMMMMMMMMKLWGEESFKRAATSRMHPNFPKVLNFREV